MKNSALPPIVRDVVLLALGTFLLIWETVVVEPGKVNILIVGAALACLGISGRFALKNLLDGKPETPPIPEPSQPSPSASPLPPQSST